MSLTRSDLEQIKSLIEGVVVGVEKRLEKKIDGAETRLGKKISTSEKNILARLKAQKKLLIAEINRNYVASEEQSNYVHATQDEVEELKQRLVEVEDTLLKLQKSIS